MTPEERSLLSQFLQDLEQARGGPKDPEAENLILQTLQRNPDAAYLLVQHTILSDQALHAAQARIADLESRAQAPQPATSFLGGAATANPNAGPWGQAPQQQPQPAPQYYQPPPAYAPQPASSFSSGGGLGSFLRGAATTAAGVAGGEMLFEGLSGIFGGHHGGFGGGFGGFGGGYGGAPVENVTVNNYNDDDGGSDRDDDSDYDDNSSDNSDY